MIGFSRPACLSGMQQARMNSTFAAARDPEPEKQAEELADLIEEEEEELETEEEEDGDLEDDDEDDDDEEDDSDEDED